MKPTYSILINTTDKFEDCWVPFFTLFREYWPNYNGKIYLNTETKVFHFPGMDIISLQNNIKTPDTKITWSECLLRALNMIDTDIVLYMQEDYFLKDFVKNEIVENYVQMMMEHQDIHCIQLTDQGSPAEALSPYNSLCTVPLKHRDRLSCQAALWKREVQKQYIRTYESAWNYEWWGSKRAGILKHNFYVVDNNWCKKDIFEIIPYICTGVIGGRWFKEVAPLFERHRITVDYMRRGFYSPVKTTTLKKRLRAKLKRLPIEIRGTFGLLLLKMRF